MATTSKCVFCGEAVRSDERKCPHCGGINEQYVPERPAASFLPKTIDELKDLCAEREFPLEQLRFFIGTDYRAPKAYGIYKAGDCRFVVYKNKADGTRSVRYDGPDEAYAVSEIYAKLLEMCQRNGMLKTNL